MVDKKLYPNWDKLDIYGKLNSLRKVGEEIDKRLDRLERREAERQDIYKSYWTAGNTTGNNL